MTLTVKHPGHSRPVLKRIPKGARAVAAHLLHKLIHDVLLHSSSSSSWSKLLGFPSACLSKPNRGGKSRNLTTLVTNQIIQYDNDGSSQPRPEVTLPRRNKPLKTMDESIAAMASAKLEDGDVKGAVRVLCSDDRLTVPDNTSFAELCHLYPPVPADRRSAPSLDTPPLQVSPAAVRAAIHSFPNGSAGGPDSLRPQHVKDLLLGAPDDSPLLTAITDLTNLLLQGKVPASVQGALFGANLLAITKKTGGVRPIAVGYVWRRLAAKVACCHVKEAATALLATRQLGFGIPGGAEAVVRSARVYLESMSGGKLLVKIDFRNAFNTVRRDFVLEAIAKHFPQLLPFAKSTMEFPSDLRFGDFVLRSEEGAQQGDPCRRGASGAAAARSTRHARGVRRWSRTPAATCPAPARSAPACRRPACRRRVRRAHPRR